MSTYVAQGLAYFLAHPPLWRMTICPVLLTIVVGMTTVIVLLGAAMYPQEQALYDAGVPEGVAWVLAIMLCLVESFVIIMVYSLICLACYQRVRHAPARPRGAREQQAQARVVHPYLHQLLSRECVAASRTAGGLRAAKRRACGGQRHVRVAQRAARGVGVSLLLLRAQELLVRAAASAHQRAQHAVHTLRHAGVAVGDGAGHRSRLHVHQHSGRSALRLQHREGGGRQAPAGAAPRGDRVVSLARVSYVVDTEQNPCMYGRAKEIITSTPLGCRRHRAAAGQRSFHPPSHPFKSPSSGHLTPDPQPPMSTYPLRGILYFLGDRHLWRLTLCPVLLTVAVAFGVAVTLFTFTLHRQERALYDAGLSTFFAWLIAVIFVIIEVFIVTVVYGLVCLEWFKDKIFAHVLIERGYRELVENEERHSPFLRVLTSCCRVSVMLRLGLLVITLPLNMIPVLGNITYAWLNGTLMAWEAHLYYFEMKAFDFEQQKEIIAARKLQYSAFGMGAMLLEMIPIAGAIFMFTNAAGAALFAASIEKELEKQERRKNSKWSWGSKDKGSKKEKNVEMDKVPLVNKLGAYVPPYGSTSK